MPQKPGKRTSHLLCVPCAAPRHHFDVNWPRPAVYIVVEQTNESFLFPSAPPPLPVPSERQYVCAMLTSGSGSGAASCRLPRSTLTQRHTASWQRCRPFAAPAPAAAAAATGGTPTQGELITVLVRREEWPKSPFVPLADDDVLGSVDALMERYCALKVVYDAGHTACYCTREVWDGTEEVYGQINEVRRRMEP